MSPVPHWPISGGACSACAVVPIALRRARCGAQRPLPLSPALGLDLRSGAAPSSDRRVRWPWTAPPPRLSLPGERIPCSRLFVEDGTRGQRRFSGAETTPRRLCPRQHRGECTSLRVWCRRVGAPANGNEDGTRGPRRTTLRLNRRGKKWKHPRFRGVGLLTPGGLIRVRRGFEGTWGVSTNIF